MTHESGGVRSFIDEETQTFRSEVSPELRSAFCAVMGVIVDNRAHGIGVYENRDELLKLSQREIEAYAKPVNEGEAIEPVSGVDIHSLYATVRAVNARLYPNFNFRGE